MERPASRASRYCVIPRSSRAVTRIFPNGHGEDFLLIFFQAHQPIHFVQQVTGRNAKPPSKTNDHPGFGLSLGVFKLIQVFLSDTCSFGKLVLRYLERLPDIDKCRSEQTLLYSSCSHILFFTFIVSSFSLKISKKTPASTPVAITNFTVLIIPGNCVPFSTFWRLL